MRRFLIPLVLLSAGTICIALRRVPANPPPVAGASLEGVLQPPPHVAAMLRRACYDCHSNETRWPWYSRIPGLREMLMRDVRDARATFNFSEWTTGPYRKPRVGAAVLLGMCSAIRAGQMPRKSYLLLHPTALPAPREVEEFCAWSNAEARRLVKESRQIPAEQTRMIRPSTLTQIKRKAN